VVLCAFALASVAAALQPRNGPAADKAFRHPGLRVDEVTESLDLLEGAVRVRLAPAMSSLQVAPGTGFYDSRTGRFSSLILRQPLLPGHGVGNRLAWPAGGAPANDEAMKAEVWKALREYLSAHRADLGLDLGQLAPSPRISILRDGGLIFVYVARVVDGIPVRDNSIGAAINSGNLVLLGLQKWGDVGADVARTPGVSANAAEDAVVAHVRPLEVSAFTRVPHLELVPMSLGDGISYRLAWVVPCRIAGDHGNWEGLVDASNGTLFAFEDRNQYAVSGQIIGGAYPLSNDQRPPDGVEQPGWPMPYVDFTVDGVKRFTDGNGNMGCIPGSISTSLSGIYFKMLDNCGPILETGTDGIDLESGPTPTSTDCSVPPGHSAGDTKSSRSGYYELSRINEQARSHLGPTEPAGIWLRTQVTANMNVNDLCNAFWDGVAVNFFKSGGGCANTGEIAAIFDHEWGHGIDNNGVDPDIATPGEAIADIYAALRLNTSCIGRGFFLNDTCGGYGDECDGTPDDGSSCTGVRDINYINHRCDQPHTISWIQGGFTDAQCGGTGSATACPGGGGPCGGEVHCEGMVMAETGWDLMTRDLLAAPFHYDAQRAHEVATTIIYAGAQPVSSWYTCSVGGGCSATGGYLSFLVADDDDGDISNGTPHMTAIRAAFERHEIHCATPAPVDSGCSGAPASAPVVTLQPRDRSVALSWTAVVGAQHYRIYRGDGIDPCEMGKVLVAEVDAADGLSYVDTGLQNGRSYSYAIMPVGDNEACTGPMSVCQPATPVAGPNLAVLDGFTIAGGDGDPFLDNCEAATIGFSINNIGVGDLTNVRILSITPVTHPSSVVLTSLPSVIAPTVASCTVAAGSFQIQPQGLTFNGSTDILVEIGADELGGDTRTKLIHVTETESDLIQVASRTFSFETDAEGWTTTAGTFVQQGGGGALGTSAHMSSSENLDSHCDVVQSPVFYLTASSTLKLFTRYDIEPSSGGQAFDRANVSLVDALTGERTVIVPSTGRPYSVADGAANGTCGTTGQAGWNGKTAGYPNLWYNVEFDQAHLNPGGAFTNRLARLEVNYGTDSGDSRAGIDFDEVTLTNFYLQSPDEHGDDCSQSVFVAPAALAVDAAGNGVLEVGESAAVSPTWTNSGLTAVELPGEITDFSGPAGPTYDLADGAASYGTIDPGASAACSDCYAVQITAASRPSVHWDASLSETVGSSSLAQATFEKVWTLHVGGSFSDVPASSGFYAFVENVLHNGVTAGCGGGDTYCPADSVTRQQMAVFLLKAKEGAGYAPPDCTTQVFDDVPCSSPFAPWVNELSVRGITAGCGPTTYCPTDLTNRQQMAVFLLKTEEGSGYVPPACTTQVFDDVPCGSPFAPWVNELVSRGVTAGCGGSNYCPASPVARQQMAVFLVKTFGLLLYGP
jgi:hypothetical protein